VPTPTPTPTAEPRRITGVGGERSESPGVRGDRDRTFHDTRAEHRRMHEALMDDRYGPRPHDRNLRPRRPQNYEHLYDPNDHMLNTFEQPLGELFLTEQMSLKKGLKYFGKKGADAVVAELRQLDYRDVIKPVTRKDLTREQRKRALNYLMYLKEKRCGRIKARGCADGRKQRDYKTKEETSSPTVSTEAVFLTAVINAQECRQVMTIDIPGAFMHVDIDELIHVRLEGPMAELLTRVDPDKYRTFMSEENGKQVLYVELQKALYGTLQASLLFWENLTEFLTTELGFEVNPYDSCVVNKIINGKQCTILWHVDDLKLSHVEQDVLEDIAAKIDNKYGQQAPIVIHRGKIHDYLGMTIDYSEEGKVKFMMPDYVDGILEEAPADMDGVSVTPATLDLFTITEGSDTLDGERSDTYHRLTAKLLYLCKRARPDLQPTVAFLTTRVVQPTVEDWKKLARGIRYLRGSKDRFLTLEAGEGIDIKWWIDASFAVHPDMRSHTGNTMSLGKGSVYSTSKKQRINTKSSTEAELVGVDDSMPLVVWTRNFLMAQGFEISDNVVFQDNQSAMLLEQNGRASSGRRTRHINIRYFFVTDRVKNGEVRIEYCPTGEMVADFFTKPLQGSLFRKLRGMILNESGQGAAVGAAPSQECVGKVRSYADVVRGTHRGSSSGVDDARRTTSTSRL
jgi:Reverse transcriptase (RNA-dependent DNA polymerase)